MKKIILISLLGFSLLSAKTFTDKRTGLFWQDDKTSEMTHAKAIEYCNKLGGNSQWRLPTIDELKSIVDYTRSPAIIEGFENTQSDYYWTSTKYKGSSTSFWVVHFSDGFDFWYLGSGSSFVRCVRQ